MVSKIIVKFAKYFLKNAKIENGFEQKLPNSLNAFKKMPNLKMVSNKTAKFAKCFQKNAKFENGFEQNRQIR